jgi:hypothetical protein
LTSRRADRSQERATAGRGAGLWSRAASARVGGVRVVTRRSRGCSSIGRLARVSPAVACLIVCSTWAATAASDRSAAANGAAATVAALVATVAERVPSEARAALARIDGDGRRLLALRSYLRAGESLADRWSWSEEQIALYEASDEARAALVEIERVRTRFAELHPGYDLYVRTTVRSLDAQISAWNDNASVGAASAGLLRSAAAWLAEHHLDSGGPGDEAVARFASWLTASRPDPAPSLAAPGLSAHGRSRAFDFQVRQGMRIVAPTDVSAIARVWDGEGWTERLAEAVAVSTHFRGPLTSPREPWHYDYAP